MTCSINNNDLTLDQLLAKARQGEVTEADKALFRKKRDELLQCIDDDESHFEKQNKFQKSCEKVTLAEQKEYNTSMTIFKKRMNDIPLTEEEKNWLVEKSSEKTLIEK